MDVPSALHVNSSPEPDGWSLVWTKPAAERRPAHIPRPFRPRCIITVLICMDILIFFIMQWFAPKYFGKGLLLFAFWAYDKTCVLGEHVGTEDWKTYFNSFKGKTCLIKQRSRPTHCLCLPSKINSKVFKWRDVFLEAVLAIPWHGAWLEVTRF